MSRKGNHSCILCYDDYVIWKPNHGGPPEMMMPHSRFREIWDQFLRSPISRHFLDNLKRVGRDQARSTDNELAAGFLLSIQFHTRLTWSKESDALLNEYIREHANNSPSYFSWKLDVRTPSDLSLAKAWLEAYYYNIGFQGQSNRVEFSSGLCEDRAGHPMLIVIESPKRALFAATEAPKIADIWDLSRVTAINGSSIDCSVEYCGKSVKLKA